MSNAKPSSSERIVGAEGPRVKMPFAIEQGNAANLAVLGVLMTALFVLTTGGYRRPWVVIAAIALGFWIPALVGALLPVNIFHGIGGPRSPSGGYPRSRDLTAWQRRLLVALYDPRNRRAAAAAVLLMSAAWLLLWLVSLALMKRPLGPASPGLRANEHAVGVLIFAWPMAGWTGLFGLTKGIRKRWSTIVSEGPAWPAEREFPGPLREAARSFFTGRLPDFIQGTSRAGV